MRSIFICVFVIGLCTQAAGAAPRHPVRQHPDRRVIVPSDEERAVPPGWYRFPGYPPIPPSENRNLDPSTLGSG